MKKITVSTKGRIVIPSEIRHKLNIKKGTRVYLEERKQEIILKPLTVSYFNEIAGVLQTKGKLSRILLKERSKER